MCMIIVQQAGKTWTKGWVRDLYEKNSDGLGVMYAEDGELHVHKYLPKSAEEAKEILDKFKDKALTSHFRMKTHGALTLENVHPYMVLTKEEGNGVAIAVGHNGILSDYTQDTQVNSDTFNYVQQILKPILTKNPDLLLEPAFQQMIGEHIGNNRLVFVTSEGNTVIINEDQGETFQSSWISNTYAISWSRRDEEDPQPIVYEKFGRVYPPYSRHSDDDYGYDWGAYGSRSVWSYPKAVSGQAKAAPTRVKEVPRLLAPAPKEEEVSYFQHITADSLKTMSSWEVTEFVYEEPDMAASHMLELTDEIDYLTRMVEGLDEVSGF
jgi:predicted glutamine amidotransferase